MFQEYVPLLVSKSLFEASSANDQPRRALSQPARSSARAGLGETSPNAVRVWVARGTTECSISIEVTPLRYDLYSGTSKNWLINWRQGVIRPQFRSLKAHSGVVSKRAE